jgi:peptidoglycan/xylan/chitin deacetylase (PgdA/CDA1 family)
VTDEPIETLPKAAGAAIALTFDDGPDPGRTEPILDTLVELDTQATFFVVGSAARRHPQLVVRLVDAGMGVGVHTWDHLDLVGRDTKLVADEIGWTVDLLTDLGCPPALFRPPYGTWDQRTMDVAAALGLACVNWSIDTHDWKGPGADAIVARVRRRLAPGSIVLMHDGGEASADTLAALPRIVDAVREKGLSTVDLATTLNEDEATARTIATRGLSG